MAVRAAMGASRWRIVRGLLAEGLVLAALGGLVGAVLGVLGLALVRNLATVEAPGIFSLMFGDSILPRAHELAVDARVLGIAFGVAALTAILVTVPPALHASRAQPMQAFGGRGGGGSRGASRFRGALVVGEVAIATVLLIAAGLLIHSFSRLSTVDRGYQASNTLVFQLVFPPGHEVARQSDTIETILSRLRAAPGVAAAGFARHGVLIGERITLGTFVPEGRTPAEMGTRPMPAVRPVSASYLTAVGAHLQQGRDLHPGDAGAVPGIVITRGTSRIFGPGGQVGRFVDWHWKTARVRLQIVGVIDDVRNERPDAEPTPEVFIDYRTMLRVQERLGEAPLWQRERALGLLSFAVRTRDDPDHAAALVTRRHRPPRRPARRPRPRVIERGKASYVPAVCVRPAARAKARSLVCTSRMLCGPMRSMCFCAGDSSSSSGSAYWNVTDVAFSITSPSCTGTSTSWPSARASRSSNGRLT